MDMTFHFSTRYRMDKDLYSEPDKMDARLNFLQLGRHEAGSSRS